MLHHPLFGACLPATLATLATLLVPRKVARGRMIFGKGDDSTDVIGIVQGSVKICAAGIDGKEAIFNVIQHGGVFGEIAALDGGPRTADAWALTDCQLVFLSRAAFLKALSADPGLARRTIELLCERIRNTTEQTEDVMTLKAGHRLAKALLKLRPDRSAPGAPPPFTQQDLAQSVGLTREITNKYLSQWQKAGWIALARGSVTILDSEALEGFVE